MELRLCKKHNAMTWHEIDYIVRPNGEKQWEYYCIKCKLEKARENVQRDIKKKLT